MKAIILIALFIGCTYAQEQGDASQEASGICDINFVQGGSVTFFKTVDSMNVVELTDERQWTA